jgi:hypothetical protein
MVDSSQRSAQATARFLFVTKSGQDLQKHKVPFSVTLTLNGVKGKGFSNASHKTLPEDPNAANKKLFASLRVTKRETSFVIKPRRMPLQTR